MSEEFDQRVRITLFTLVIALFTVFAQPVAALAQTSVNERAIDPSPLPIPDVTRPGPDASTNVGPALLALADVAGTGTAASGGLWLSGDTARGIAHLQWIAGTQSAGLLKMGSGGKVSFDIKVLARAAGIASDNTAGQRERIASFVRSDEGLRLLAEVTNGAYRYLLHVGPTAPTLAGHIRFNSTVNLDDRFDSRINPRRPSRQKLEIERPPKGFDSLIAINPEAHWFNLHCKRFIPAPQITFHELAEAHARLILGLDYLPQYGKPGAHEVAIDREIRLRNHRPGQIVVMPIGVNYLRTSPGN